MVVVQQLVMNIALQVYVTFFNRSKSFQGKNYVLSFYHQNIVEFCHINLSIYVSIYQSIHLPFNWQIYLQRVTYLLIHLFHDVSLFSRWLIYKGLFWGSSCCFYFFLFKNNKYITFYLNYFQHSVYIYYICPPL